MWKATLRSLLARKLRLALTALAVVLGVAFVAGTFVLTDTLEGAFDRLVGEGTRGLDVLVRAKSPFDTDAEDLNEREPVPASLVATVRDVPGVAMAEGTVGNYAQLVNKDGEAIETGGAPTIGVSWDRIGNALRLRSGRAPERDGEVVIDAVSAREHGFDVGDSIRVLFAGPPGTFEIVGIAGFAEADNFGGATLAAFDLATAQRWMGERGLYDAINVRAADGVSASELRLRIAGALPDRYEAVTGQRLADERQEAIAQGIGFFKTALLVFAAVSLLVGAFIIFNTFSILVAQRTRELALVRALGASRAQVTRSVVAEAVIVGLVSSAVGIGVGFLVAVGLQSLLQAVGIDLPNFGTVFRARTVWASVIVGVGVTTAASVIPARRAARVPPVAAMRDTVSGGRDSSPRRATIGAVVTVVGLALILAGLFAGLWQPALMFAAGALVVFLGVAVLSPFAARPVARAVGAPLPRWFGVPGKLGRENAIRNPRRTAATAAALMIGLGLVGFVSIFAASLKDSLDKVIDDNVGAEFVLTANLGRGAGLSPEVAERLARLPELGAVAADRHGRWRLDGERQALHAGTPDTIFELQRTTIVAGDGAAAMRDEELLVREDVARIHAWDVGDVVTMEFARTGFQRVRIGAIFAKDGLSGEYMVSLRFFERNFREQLDDIVMASPAGGVPADEARAAIERVLVEFPNVRLDDLSAFKERQQEQINQLLGLVSALLALAVIIALFGIVNTLSLSIFERTRELGLLRAVGMTRRQVRAMVRWESVIIAIFGAVLGMAIALFFGWALVRALADEGIEIFSVPGGQLAAYLFAAGIAGVAAAIGPARRAARLDVLQAIATE